MEQFFPYLAALASLVAILSAILKWGRPVRKAFRWLRVHSAGYQVRQLQRHVAALEARLAELEITVSRLRSKVPLDHYSEVRNVRQHIKESE